MRLLGVFRDELDSLGCIVFPVRIQAGAIERRILPSAAMSLWLGAGYEPCLWSEGLKRSLTA